MPEVKVIKRIEFPRNVWDAMVSLSDRLGKNLNEYIVGAVYDDIDSSICNNCDRLTEKMNDSEREQLSISLKKIISEKL